MSYLKYFLVTIFFIPMVSCYGNKKTNDHVGVADSLKGADSPKELLMKAAEAFEKKDLYVLKSCFLTTTKVEDEALTELLKLTFNHEKITQFLREGSEKFGSKFPINLGRNGYMLNFEAFPFPYRKLLEEGELTTSNDTVTASYKEGYVTMSLDLIRKGNKWFIRSSNNLMDKDYSLSAREALEFLDKASKILPDCKNGEDFINAVKQIEAEQKKNRENNSNK